MKNYIKPNLDLINISLNKEMATGLSGWVESNGISENSITACEFSYIAES